MQLHDAPVQTQPAIRLFWFISGKFKPWVRGNSPSCRGTFLILIYTEINIYLKSWTKFLLNNCQPSKLEQKKIIVNRQSYNPPPAPLSRPPLRERKKLKDETIEDGGIVRYLAWDHALYLLSLYVSHWRQRSKEANKQKITPDLRLFAIRFSLNFIRLLRVVITPSVRGEKDSKQSDEFLAISD